MSKTLVQQARQEGALKVFFDFRFGTTKDQSGNGLTLTMPSDASLGREGLRCRSAPASVALDLSGTQNIGVFMLMTSVQIVSSVQSIAAELTSDHTSSDNSFAIYWDTTQTKWIGALKTSSGYGICGIYRQTRTDREFVSWRFDRRLTYEASKGFSRGIYKRDYSSDSSMNTGTAFANDTVYLGGRNGGTLMLPATIQAFGIVDFTVGQWSISDQAKLWTEIRERKTC